MVFAGRIETTTKQNNSYYKFYTCYLLVSICLQQSLSPPLP